MQSYEDLYEGEDLNKLFCLDPYEVPRLLSEEAVLSFFQKGQYHLHHYMGAQKASYEGVEGIRFVVFAPKAKTARLCLYDFQGQDCVLLMKKISDFGFYELFIPNLEEGQKYLFQIETNTGVKKLKTDPFGFAFEKRPNYSSLVSTDKYNQWTDHNWLEERKTVSVYEKPLNIYKVHLGSWFQPKKGFENYRELAPRLAKYCHKMGFTDIELLPIVEHPLDESWGYQVTGYFAPTSRYGTRHDFCFFVDYLHSEGIGVIFDFVPGHFPVDEWSLVNFDGEAVFEHKEFGIHPTWNTRYFDYKKNEVVNFLISSVIHFIDNYHVDGVRVDAVASIVHLDFGHEEGDWKPNRFGGKEHLEGIEFLKTFNKALEQNHPDVVRIAEDTSTFQGMTFPISQGGLGFHYKWNLGFSYDIVTSYLSKAFDMRHHDYYNLTFAFEYAFKEQFILPLSHDEVTNEKKNFLEKFFGTEEEKVSQYKMFLILMIFFPGKKLIFMGQEFGRCAPWICTEPMHLSELEKPLHKEFQAFCKNLFSIYLQEDKLSKNKCLEENFQRVFFKAPEKNFLVYIIEDYLCLYNFSQKPISKTTIQLKNFNNGKLLISSAEGVCRSDLFKEGDKNEITVDLPPLTAAVYQKLS